jgi:hypothetical protein
MEHLDGGAKLLPNFLVELHKWQWWIILTNSMRLAFSEHPLRCSMDLMDLRARSRVLADWKFMKLGHLAKKNQEQSCFLGFEAT